MNPFLDLFGRPLEKGNSVLYAAAGLQNKLCVGKILNKVEYKYKYKYKYAPYLILQPPRNMPAIFSTMLVIPNYCILVDQ